MTIDFNGNHSISKETAIAYTKAFRLEYPNQDKAFALGGEIIQQILAQPTCTGLRIYNAVNDQNQRDLVIVGVDKDGKDLVDGVIADRTFRCPPYCDSGSALNS